MDFFTYRQRRSEKDPDTGEEKFPEVDDEKLLPDLETIV